MPRCSRGGGGWAQVELTDALSLLFFITDTVDMKYLGLLGPPPH